MAIYFNFLGQYSKANFTKDEYASVKLPDKKPITKKFINFKSNLYLSKKDKEVIKENDKKYLTPVGSKKISLSNLAIVSGASGAAGYGTGELTNMWRQKKAGLKMTGQGIKAKLIGAGLAGGLGGGLSYYLQTRKTRSDKGRKRK